MRISCFLILWATSSLPLLAQNTKIGYIFNKYLDIQDRIPQKKLFVDEFKLNSNKRSWNSNLIHQRTEKYFYDVFINQHPFLNLVKVQIDSITTQYEIEYMFDHTGNLLLCIEKQTPKKFFYNELRTYFENEKLILWVEDEVVVKSSTIFQSQKVKYFLESAKFYWQKFQKRMKE